MGNMKIICVSLAAEGLGVSGGDRIWIELVHRWSRNNDVSVYTSKAGKIMFDKFHTNDKIKFIINQNDSKKRIITYIKKTIWGIVQLLKINDDVYIFSASEFIPDIVPSSLLKLKNSKKTILISSWFQTAPNPIKGFTYNKGILTGRSRKQALLYWGVQKLTKPIIQKLSDIIFVNNESEKMQFANKHTEVMLGAVDYEKIELFKKNHDSDIKKYLAVYQGRFHPQKGVLELIDIWDKVVKNYNDAKLVMIGDGPLMEAVKKKISKYNLNENIILTGYLFDGEEKYKLFSQSKIVVHPSLYDSGGMASAEAMAFGLPCIAYQMPSYDSYYPNILNLVKYDDKDEFAKKIIYLAQKPLVRLKMGRKSESYIKKSFTWKQRADQVLRIISHYEA